MAPETTFTPLASLAGGVLIGFAAILLMAAVGRIAGVSGYVSRLLPPYTDGEFSQRLAFVAGLILAPFAVLAATGQLPAHELNASLPVVLIGGLLVGFGSVIGNGCTSGHGVCGIARLSKRSLAATAVFMTTAIATVYVARHVVGG
jgi:uncharacterized membrane protein YedE/YeeE